MEVKMKKNIFVLFALLVCGAPLFGAEAELSRAWLNQERKAIVAERARISRFIPEEGMDEDHPDYQYVRQAMDAVTARETRANEYEQQLIEYEAGLLRKRLAERERLLEMQKQQQAQRPAPTPKPKPEKCGTCGNFGSACQCATVAEPLVVRRSQRQVQTSCESCIQAGRQSCSCAQAAPQSSMLRVRTGGVGDQWLFEQQQRALPLSQRQRQANRDADFANQIYLDQLAEEERASQRAIQQLLAEDGIPQPQADAADEKLAQLLAESMRLEEERERAQRREEESASIWNAFYNGYITAKERDQALENL